MCSWFDNNKQKKKNARRNKLCLIKVVVFNYFRCNNEYFIRLTLAFLNP